MEDECQMLNFKKEVLDLKDLKDTELFSGEGWKILAGVKRKELTVQSRTHRASFRASSHSDYCGLADGARPGDGHSSLQISDLSSPWGKNTPFYLIVLVLDMLEALFSCKGDEKFQ